MPLLEDYGTLKGISFNDFWTSVTFTVVAFDNYERLSISSKHCQLFLETWINYPYYITIKIGTNLSGGKVTLGLRDDINDYRWKLDIDKDKVRDPTSTNQHVVDMSTPRVITVLMKDKTTGIVWVDGVEAFVLDGYSFSTSVSDILLESDASFTGTVDVYQMKFHKNPIELIKYYWFEFLKKWVMDPSDRDAPGNFITYRYPVATFPTEILKPRLDFRISHNMRQKPNPHSPTFHADSLINISAYIKNDIGVEGFTNVEAIDNIQANLDTTMQYALGEIPFLLNYSIDRKPTTYDRRNEAWVGNYVVRAEHFLELI